MARGGNVAVFDLNAERGGELVSELGDQTAFFECNVMEEESIDAAVAGAHEKFGALHGAVNCAGGSFGGGLCVNRRGEATDMETWWKTVQLNLYSTMAVCSKVSAISALQDEVTEDGERGVLVNVASAAAPCRGTLLLLLLLTSPHSCRPSRVVFSNATRTKTLQRGRS